MKQNKWFKKAVSGLLTAVTLLTSAVSPLTVMAAEPSPEEQLAAYVSSLPELNTVREQLDADEIVTAKNYEVEFGAEVDLQNDFTKLEIPDEKKVSVSFFEAKDSNGNEFSTSHADSYHAVYYVEPVNTEHPAYRISRTITVKEPVQTEAFVTGDSDGGQEEGTDDGAGEDADADSMKEAPLYEMSYEEIMQAGAALVEKAIQSGEDETSFAGEDLELYQRYQEFLSSGGRNGIALFADTASLVVKNAQNETGMWDIPLLDYIDSSTTEGPVYNYVKYIADDSANGWRLAYCLQISKHFIDSTQYIGTEWEQNGMYAEISYAIANGCKKYGQTNNAAYSTGNWIKDYYVTQTVIYCILSDYGYDGHPISSLSAVSGYQDVYDCVLAMYKDVKKNGNKAGDGYGDDPACTITAPASTAMKLNADGTYYQTGWYSVNVSGEMISRSLSLSEAPEGTEIVYKDPNSTTSDFYLRIPVQKAYAIGDRTVTFKVKSTATFSRPVAYNYQSQIADAQNVTFLEKKTTNPPKSSEAEATLKLDKAKISVVKVDAQKEDVKLAGAVFGVYKDQACTQLITEMPATDANGSSTVEIVVTQDTVYLKEISAPKGYVYRAEAQNIRLVAGQDSKVMVPNQEVMGKLTIYKEGEVMTGALAADDGVIFQYEKRRLAGATYQVIAGEDIVAADGTLVYKNGAVVVEKLTTDSDGKAVLSDLHLGSYVVTEIGAPENYTNKGESKTVTLTETDPTQEVVAGEAIFFNDRQKVSLTVNKVDDTTKAPLTGGVYGLFAGETIENVSGEAVLQKDTLIQKAVTDADGKAVFTADLPLNAGYYVKELQAPEKYVRNEADIFTFRTDYTTEMEPVIEFSYTFENERVNARIDLLKKDAETGATAQGDACLEGASYGLYAREDIIHPDGKTGVIYQKDTQVATLTTDGDGKASIDDLYLGKYYIKELAPSEGYLLDDTEYDLDCADEGDMVKTVKKSVVLNEQVIKQPFQVIKAVNNGKTDADLLSGVGFTAYLISSLKQNADGSYDFTSAAPVVITEDGQTEMFTDERGHAQSIALPYGKYIVRETTTPHNFSPVKDFTVTVQENHPATPQVWRVLLDEEFEAKLKIVKKDDETKKPILLPDTEFKVYDMEKEAYVEQVTTYPKTEVHKSYFTDENGCLILPEGLHPGHYRIEEVTAPKGYTLHYDGVKILVDSNTAYEMDGVSGDTIITVEMENKVVKGKLTIVKKGEVLAGYDKDFSYEIQSLAGAEFAIYAAEDIYTPDYQKDADGNRMKIYAKDALVATAVTGEDGSAVVENLPLGSYYVKETKAPEGFVLNRESQRVTLAWQDQDTPVVFQTVEFTNDRQKVSISVEKQDAETGAKVGGAAFGLYAKEEIKVGDKVLAKADELLEEAVSDENGIAAFTLDLPFGKYYVKETKAPDGFVSSGEVLDFDAAYQGQDIPAVTLNAVKKNEPTTLEITKSDITTGVELDGAELTVLDKEGNVIDRWTSVKGEPHVIRYLTAGESYVLREEFAPYGYLKATEVTFTVADTEEVQKVEMKDEVPTALLIINKKGEFLDNVSLLENAKGFVEHLFEYVTGGLTEVTFEVYAAEDIKVADGISGAYYKKDTLIGTITTGDNGTASLGGLPLGKYYVKEAKTDFGYVLDGEPRYVDLTYRDQDTPVVTFDENWQNRRQKVSVHVLKVEKETGTPLAGGVFGLFAGEDILSASGKVLMEKDALIELKATDSDGKIRFTADLPVGGKYYVQEQCAPAGYVAGHEKQEFTFEYGGADQAEVEYEFIFENEATTVEFTKSDLTTGEELPGAHLEVRDGDGNLVDAWVSTEEAHVICKLAAGKEYTLTETLPADGYVTAESITFTVGDTAGIQKVVMEDDVTKVKISKTDMATGKELPGAKLTILDAEGNMVESWVSGEEPHYIEKLPVGKYTLREETAPDGYQKAEDVKFTVEDTGEIQEVEMKDAFVSVTDTPSAPDTPKTGDDSKPLLWGGLAVIGLLLLGVSLSLSKKKKNR